MWACWTYHRSDDHPIAIGIPFPNDGVHFANARHLAQLGVSNLGHPYVGSYELVQVFNIHGVAFVLFYLVELLNVHSLLKRGSCLASPGTLTDWALYKGQSV